MRGRGARGWTPSGPGAVVLAWLWVGLWLLVVLRTSQGDLSADWTRAQLEALIRLLGFGIEHVAFTHLLIRKAAHVLEYAVLGFLSFRAAGRSLAPPRAAACALLLCAAVAAADEAHQATLPTRTGSPRDVVFDLAGAVLGLAVRRRTTGTARAAAAGSPA